MGFAHLAEALSQREDAGLLRQRHVVESSAGALFNIDGQHYLNFSSNDYLGQRQHLDVLQAWVEGVSTYGVGSGASPLVTGHTRAHQALEDYLAEHLNREKVLLFSSGFAANQAICQALLSTNSTVFADKLMHASFVEAARQYATKFARFKHNNMSHLGQLLTDKPDNCLIASEGIFSMDGDRGDLSSMVELSRESNAWLMVDDAHGMGVRGKKGLGSIEELNLSQSSVPVLMGTFGKAIGTGGAFVAGSSELIDYLINFAKHYVYSTSMPPAMAMASLASLNSLADGEKQQILQQRIEQFSQLCDSAGIQRLPSDSAIQAIVIGDPVRCVSISQRLKSMGLWCSAIRHPTVPKHTDRLRITLSSSHQKSDIDALVDALHIALQTLDDHPHG